MPRSNRNRQSGIDFTLDRERFQKFRELRNEAQLYAAQLMVLDPAEHQKALFATALAALAVYGQDSQAPATSWSLVQPLPDALDPKEKDEVKGGCHDLLLILSEAMDPAEGLKVLDRAARLVPEPTVGDHLLRAALLARTNDAAGQAREEQLAAKLKPSHGVRSLAHRPRAVGATARTARRSARP